MISNIRILGLLVSVLILIAAFLYLRGKRWSRLNFVISVLTATVLLVVSVNPNAANVLENLLHLEDFEYGRILSLLVLSNLAVVAFGLYTKTKVDSLKVLLDRSLCASVINAVEPHDEILSRTKPIMIIIPALNEAENLHVLLRQIPSSVCGIDVGVVVVDDGSSDETSGVAVRNGFLAAKSLVNRGQGAASRVGYGFLAKHGVRYGVTMDADNQHRPEDIEKVLSPIIEGQYDLVIGSRVLGSGDYESRSRYAGVILFSRLVGMLTGVRLTDCSSGFKAFNVLKLMTLDLREDQFQSSEVLISAAKRGLRIGEVPIHIKLRSFGESRKGTNMKYGFLFLKTMAKTWWR